MTRLQQPASPLEEEAYCALLAICFTQSGHHRAGRQQELQRIGTQKGLFSSPAAALESTRRRIALLSGKEGIGLDELAEVSGSRRLGTFSTNSVRLPETPSRLQKTHRVHFLGREIISCTEIIVPTDKFAKSPLARRWHALCNLVEAKQIGAIVVMKESCAVTGLLHVLVKTNDLPRTLVFYKSVLGLREAQRPPFGFPGAWMGCATANGELVIHIWAGGPGMGKDGVSPYGSATIDHVSLSAVGYRGFREKFERFGLPWREFVIPNTTLFQLFVYDPSGVQIELTFDLGAEPSYETDIDPAHRYSAGEVFFDLATYPDLLAIEKAA